MNLAAVFWFYKEPDICRNRLEILRKHNPDIKIYGLFGGNKNEENLYKEKIGDLLDDFYTSSYCDKDADYKWMHGDIMLLDWYEKHGKDLEWDSVIIIQWDILVFDLLKNQFPGLQKRQIFLSGLRELDPETENRWTWTTPKKEYRKNYLAFRDYVKKEYGYFPKRFLCCLYILEILPRDFFDSWSTVQDKFIGMLEYKIPTYADIFKIPFYKKDLGVWWWDRQGNLPMNARPIEITAAYIKLQLEKKNGYRIFHPYSEIWKS